MQERQIRQLFKERSGAQTSLLKVDKSDYQAATISLLKTAADQDIPVIYVGAKRPYVHLRKLLQDNHISEDFIYVVDTITKTVTDEGIVEADNVRYLESPQNLTNVSTAISIMAEKAHADNALLLIDSLETMLTYNTERAVSTFLDDLNDRTKTLELDMALFKEEGSMDEQIGSSLYPIVDKIQLLSKETEAVVITEKTDDHTTIELPTDIARALHWNEGDELSFNLHSDNTLSLEKK